MAFADAARAAAAGGTAPVAVFLGIAGTSFAVGISYVSRWFLPDKQGTALGIYGAGNIGQSVAVFGAPLLASWLGLSWAVWIFAAVALAYALYFFSVARDAEWHVPAKSFTDMMSPFVRAPVSWALSLFYFQTFGGFVALSIYMPMLLKDLFQLTPADAGFRTAMFVIVATDHFTSGARPDHVRQSHRRKSRMQSKRQDFTHSWDLG